MHKKKNVLPEPAPGNQLPEVLQNRAFKFVLITKGKKRPCEKNWPDTNNYHYDDPKLLRHLKSGGNYGVLCGPGGLVVVDVDNPQWIENIRAALPETCTVKTGGGGYHFYLIVKGYGGKTILYDPETGDHIGEVQSGKMTKGEQRTQVVGPGSLHPTGNTYQVVNATTIAQITAQALKDSLLSCGVVFERTKNDRIPREILTQSITTRHAEHDAGVDTLRIEDVVDLSGFKELKPGVYQGPHPVHGSETGHNLVIDTNQNLWHCLSFQRRQELGYHYLSRGWCLRWNPLWHWPHRLSPVSAGPSCNWNPRRRLHSAGCQCQNCRSTYRFRYHLKRRDWGL